MLSTRRSSFVRYLWILLFTLVIPAWAAEPKVSATLSSATAAVGESVTFEITIDGNFAAENTPPLNVDGLDIRGPRYSSQILMLNLDVTRKVILSYRLAPTREGKITIPSLEFPVGGKVLKTRELTLTATPARQLTKAGDLAFSEITLGKADPYLGEAISIELRIYVDSTVMWDARQRPVLSGSGFTLKPFGSSTKSALTVGNKSYDALIFSSTIIPGKAGKSTIGPLPMKIVYQKTRVNIFGRREPAGPVQEMDVIAPAVEMDAKLLPTEGRPADFSGAVGKFELEAAGTPSRLNVGEPVEMNITIRGEGNFDHIDVPPIVEPDGWHTYDAESKFEASDDSGLTGTKTFRLPVAPTKRKTTMPVFSFTYFDPTTAKYRELRSGTYPLTVLGADAVSTPAPTAASPSNDQPPAAAPTPAAPQDILGILPQSGLTVRPGVSARTMYLLLGAPIPILAALVFWRRRAGDALARRIQRLKRERAIAFQEARSATSTEKLYDAAAHTLQLDAALASGKEAQACDLADILAAREMNPETARAVEELFEARAAFAYAGGTRESGSLRANDRDRVLETLAAYERSKGR